MVSMSAVAPHTRSIGMAAVAIAGLPLAWNVVARNEYRHHSLERLFRNKRLAVYALAAAIFAFSGLRDAAFMVAVQQNGSDVLPILPASITERGGHTAAIRAGLRAAGGALTVFGTTLVVSAFARLGVTGTYLGDYFGIKMRERVTAFPFSHFENPMYLGAACNFLGAAIAANSAVGVGLTGWVCLVYYISSKYFENPFTAIIYGEDSDAAEAAK